MHFDMRPGDQGYLTGTLIFVDDSKLHFSEYVDQTGEVVDKLMYTYHYQDTGNQLIFRYDNALHKSCIQCRYAGRGLVQAGRFYICTQ